MDRFDGIAIVAITGLFIGSLALMYGHQGAGKPGKGQIEQTAAAAAPTGELDSGVKVAGNLIEAGKLAQAGELVRELQKKFPYRPELFMLMGDVFMRSQEPVKAMHEYKEAIDLNPDYLDKKTPLFQGRKLKVAVGEAMAEIEKQLQQRPADAALKNEKKTIYYLYRKIAGSCG